MYKPEFIQVAGHTRYGEQNVPCIITSDDGLRIFKLIQQPPRGQKELIFYRQINGNTKTPLTTTTSLFSDSGVTALSRRVSYAESSVSSFNSKYSSNNHDAICEDMPKSKSHCAIQQSLQENLLSEFDISEELLKKLREDFVAKFFGVKTVNGYDYLELERIGAKFGEGMIATADIKIGKVTYDPLASEAKKARSNKWEALPFVGYQYLGIKRGNEALIDKSFCRGLKLSEIHKVHEQFLPVNGDKRGRIVGKIIEKLDEIIAWFEQQSSLQFYGSSLLVMYNLKCESVELKMIDFAHVFYERGIKDENYLFGVKNLRQAYADYL